MTCILGCDHAGLSLSKHLIRFISNLSFVTKVIEVIPKDSDIVDYPDFASVVCKEVLNEVGSLGILICGSGIGMSISANKIKGIRAALCTNEYMAKYARAHNDANVLCLGQRVIGNGIAEDIVNIFLNTSFDIDRHLLRVDKIKLIES